MSIESNKMIDILLATYNGEDYIEEQINSILEQTIDNWRIIVRDDGSSDGTNSILQKYAILLRDKFQIIDDANGNVGVVNNFSILMGEAVGEYIMFCDQDDVWHPTKIECFINKMEKAEKECPKKPILIHSDMIVVNKSFDKLSDSFWSYQGLDASKKEYTSLLVKNNVTGCASMINKQLCDQVRCIPAEAIMHDWWLALYASVFGEIFVIEDNLSDYRQHDANRLGAQQYNFAFVFDVFVDIIIFKKLHLYQNKLIATQHQAKSFLEVFGQSVSRDVFRVVFQYAHLQKKSWIGKRLFILRYKIFQQGFFRTIGMLILI